MTVRSRHPHRRMTVLALAAAGTLVTALAAASVGAPANSAPSTGSQEIRPHEPGPDEAGPDVSSPKSNAPSRVPAKNVPTVAGLPVTGTTGVSTRIDGLTMKDQRTSNGGNSFSLEPPDQGLCVGNGFVLEAVNNVFAVYNGAGARVSPIQSLVPFFTGQAEVIRNAAGVIQSFGPFMSDPKCYFDPDLHRWFLTELELGTDPATGDFTGVSFEDIAVSKSDTPTTNPADWFFYRLNVRNDGTQGTPSHTGCPCFGDQPLIGADRYGFYISTNEFPIEGAGFNGAQIYAFDKAALTTGTMRVQRIEDDGTPLAEGTAYSVQPATSPTAAQWSNASNGTEFALSALEFTGGFDNRIATWALTNTQSLTTATPAVQIAKTVIRSQVYGFPPAAQQKAGPIPLGDALKNKENLLESNDDRMNQAVYSNGKLWSGVNTAIKTNQSHPTAGISYFVVAPHVSGAAVSATVSNQGYVAATGQSTIFPSIGVTSTGSAVMTFTLTGKRFFPTSAIVHLNAAGNVTSGIQRLADGVVPADGFTGYPAEGPFNGVERWGDYSAAVADTTGRVWVASEYVPGTYGFPPFIANWGTFVASVTP